MAKPEIVCPECRSTSVHRSRRAGFREEVALRFLFARPFRCAKCKTRFYRVGKDWGFKLWVVERGQVSSDGSGEPTDLEPDEEEAATINPRVEPRPPAFWEEVEPAMVVHSHTRPPKAQGQMELQFSPRDPSRAAAISSSALNPPPSSAKRGAPSSHGHHAQRSRGHRKMSQQTKILIWLAVGSVILVSVLLYLFWLFSAQAKQQKLVRLAPVMSSTVFSSVSRGRVVG
ncbi:MAG: hypothetical protein PHX83_03950 [Acidobacteriia bacterium]|nr:hypothetical protein [Terriglobia bacterium]